MSYQLDDNEDSLFSLDPKDEARAVFVSQAGRALQSALVHRKESRKFTQQDLANALGVDRSRVNRCFSGAANLTLGTFAELAWALGGVPEIRIVYEDAADEQPNYPDDPPALTAFTSSTSAGSEVITHQDYPGALNKRATGRVQSPARTLKWEPRG